MTKEKTMLCGYEGKITIDSNGNSIDISVTNTGEKMYSYAEMSPDDVVELIQLLRDALANCVGL